MDCNNLLQVYLCMISVWLRIVSLIIIERLIDLNIIRIGSVQA